MTAMQKDESSRKAAFWNKEPIPHVAKVIAIASGKGGVGKSTVTVMLAHVLAQAGRTVGILDADIYGPSVPRMLGLSGKPELRDNKMVPPSAHGIACNSMGFLLEESQAAIWRGPMITKAVHQLARLTDWGVVTDHQSPERSGEARRPSEPPAKPDKSDKMSRNGSILLVDMPPGTGDIHLSMVQQVPLDAVILVTTPQDVAVQDARKCADMFRKVNIPIIGVIENMSWLEDTFGNRLPLFGEGGGTKLAQECGAPLLAQIPLMPELGKILDCGRKPAPEMLQPFTAAYQASFMTTGF